MSCELSVIAPCFNEAGNIPELVARLLAVFDKKAINGQVVLVNDGSRDQTGVVAERLAAQHPRVVVRHHERNQGIVAGWSTGVAAASGEYVCFIDADLQYLPEDVYRLYREIRHTNADMVQGYRSSVGRLRNSRYTLSVGLNLMLNNLFGTNFRDCKSGFVIALRETMQDVLRYRKQYKHFQTFITISAVAKGYRVHEIETLFESRLVGSSFIPKWPVGLIKDVVVDLGKAFVEFRLDVKREDIVRDYLKDHQPSRASRPRPTAPATAPGQADGSASPTRDAALKAFFATMPLHKWMITRRAGVYLTELRQSQWLAPAEVRDLQNKKVRRLIHHAYHHVAYYRQLMDDRGVKPSDVQTIEDLQRLPLLTKKDVRENLYFDLLADNHDKKKILRINTSGSTGEPFVCYADQHQLEIRWANTLRAMEWTGYRFGDRQARLWHQTIGMSRSQALRERIDAFLSRRLFIPAYEMSEDTMPTVVQRLARHRPVLIDGYAESFNFLAHYLKQHPDTELKVKAVMSSAQVLPESSRAIIEQVLGCEVYDKYGSREFSGIAYECEQHDGHHICAESYVVEVLRDGKPALPGQTGEVVITDLNNFCMPFIRYRIGDQAGAQDKSHPCPCGRGLPRLGQIEGRVQAIVFTADGRFLPGTFFAHLFKDYDYLIRQYQVVQLQPGSIRLKIIKGPRFDQAEFEAEVLKQLRKYLGKETEIDIEFVDAIPMVRTGKHQGSISMVDFDFQSLKAR